ncbi:MAG: chaperonin GroEL [Fimbriimonadales bacterium]
MAKKEILYGDSARRSLFIGATKLAEAVRPTLGPRGRVVGLSKKFGAPLLIDDGVTIAKDIELEDSFENMGVALVREASTKTNDQAGDGTTTAIILAHALIEEGLRTISAGINATALQRGMAVAVDAVVAEIAKSSKKLKGSSDAVQVATVSSKDESIGKLVGETLHKVGLQGVVTVEEGKSLETSVDMVEGLRFDKGYMSPYFITDVARMEAVLDDPLILFHEKKISSVADFLPFLETAARTGRPIVVIAEDIENEALALLVLNRLRSGLKVAAVKAPGFGERRKAMLEDVAILTGGTVVSEDIGMKLENVTLEMLGNADRVIVTKDHTTIVGGKGQKTAISGRVKQIQSAIAKSDSKYDKEKMSERLAALSGGVAVVKVGAATETAMRERKAKVEDAIAATRAAMEEGVVVGGGVTLLRAASVISKLKLGEDESVGAGILAKALEAPLRAIADNSGAEGRVVVQRVKEAKGSNGFDAGTLEYKDLEKAGVIDPAKVVRLTVQNAASIAGMILTTEAAVGEPSDDEDEPHTPPAY